MPRFFARNPDALVSTSYKVMYSSMVESDALEEIDDAEFRLLATERVRGPGLRHIMAVRDPYGRLASFFADKLRRNLQRNSGSWQFSQLIFFPLVGVSADGPFEAARDALLGISFDAFIDFLPIVCGNGHLRPQVSLLSAEGLDLRPHTEIFPIETASSHLWQAIGVERPPRANRSEALPDLTMLTRQRLDIVQTVYADDFSSFGYDLR